MSLDAFFDKRYNYQHYHCAHFVRDVWWDLTGSEVDMSALFAPVGEARAGMELRRKFERLDAPVSPCIVHMSGGNDSHVGVYVDGKIIHIGAEFVEFLRANLVTHWYRNVKYFRPIC